MTPRTLQRHASLRPHDPLAPLRRAGWLAALCIVLSSTASAQDTPAGGSDFRLNGFGTLGGDAVAEIGVNIGMASTPRHGRHRRELMHAADEAMYWVKRHGKNGYATALAEA